MEFLRLSVCARDPNFLYYFWSTWKSSSEESSELLDSELVLSSHELGDSSSSTTSLALRFQHAWARTRSINSALLPLILRPFCLRLIFSCLSVSAFTSFQLTKKKAEECSFPYSVFGFCVEEFKVLYITFTCSLVHVVLGAYLLQRPFLRRSQFSLVEQSLYLDSWEKLIDLFPVYVAVMNSNQFPGEVECIKFNFILCNELYIQPPFSPVVIFSHAPPLLIFHPLQVNAA